MFKRLLFGILLVLFTVGSSLFAQNKTFHTAVAKVPAAGSSVWETTNHISTEVTIWRRSSCGCAAAEASQIGRDDAWTSC